MQILNLPEIRHALDYGAVIGRMRQALVAWSRGECEMPMPMHLAIAPENAEVHIKSSYRRGGKYFALKIASTFPGNPARGLATGNGMLLLSSAETGEPAALLADAGYLTDVRTAAVAAMMARELGRRDRALGILGAGVQARLQAHLHAAVLDLDRLWIWGRTAARAEECARELREALPGVEVVVAQSPAEVARQARLIVTCTAARAPLLGPHDLHPGTLISAVGSDAVGKQELDAEILRRADRILVDSRAQCEKLGELQHAPGEWERAIEMGAFLEPGGGFRGHPVGRPAGLTVCDFTGLGIEDLFIAEYCYENRPV
ncbi:MAG: ornithine cyclodeaminase family protein [Bryobacteraceae bacterium]